MVSDGNGPFVLHTTMTAQGSEPGEPGQVTVTGAQTGSVVGAWLAEGSQSTVANTQTSITGVSEQVVTAHSQLPTAYYLEQVFSDIDPMLTQESMVAQPGAILNTELNEQTNLTGTEKALLQPLADTQTRLGAGGIAAAPWPEWSQHAGRSRPRRPGGVFRP